MTYANASSGSADTAAMLASIFTTISNQGVYPVESISNSTSSAAGHLWLARHEREWDAIVNASNYTATDSILALIGKKEVLDDMIDRLISVAMVLYELCEYTQSTIAMHHAITSGDALSSMAVINVETEEAVSIGDDGSEPIRELTGSIARQRIQDLPMQHDHLYGVISAIRVLMILKEAMALPVIQREKDRDGSAELLDRIFAKGSKIDPGHVAAHAPDLFDEDGKMRYGKRDDLESEEPIDDNDE